MIIDPLYRYELKFKLDGSLKDIYKKSIKSNAPGFKMAYPPRYVNNIYFDKIGFENYYDNINGNPNRSKTRIRWYGNFFDDNSSSIEIKEKKGALIKKTIFDFPLFSIVEVKKDAGVFKNFKHDHNLLKGLKSTVINRYYREYYISLDNRFRITIDSYQSYSDPKNIFFPRKIHPFLNVLIIEIKFNPIHYSKLNQLTNTLGLRIGKNSKYVNSLNALNLHFF